MTSPFKRPIEDCHIGVAGCGAMGLPMLEQLVQAGFAANGYDIRSMSHYAGFERYMMADPSAFAAQTDILISVVRDFRQTEELCFTTQNIFAGDNYPRILILSSTLSPNQVRQIASRLPADVAVIDAPMSGAPVAAIEGTLTFMVGAEKDQFEYLLPLFRVMGTKISHIGKFGSGMSVKVLNNYVAACSVVAVRRVLETAGDLGLDRGALLDVMKASSGATWFGDKFDVIDWAEQGFEPGNTIAILEKDVLCALDAGGASGADPDVFDNALLSGLRRLKALEPE